MLNHTLSGSANLHILSSAEVHSKGSLILTQEENPD
jgi:hypothetical protein